MGESGSPTAGADFKGGAFVPAISGLAGSVPNA